MLEEVDRYFYEQKDSEKLSDFLYSCEQLMTVSENRDWNFC